MLVPSHDTIKEVSIQVCSPIISGGHPIRIVTDEIETYGHVIASDGGFISAEISMKANLEIADEWLSDGLGRHIQVNGHAGDTAWEGFVNKVSINFGNYTIERGNLTDVCNRCLVLYTPIIDWDPESGEPITGVATETIIAEDEDSQKKYGIWEQAISGGVLLPEDAEYLRDVYLNENKDPVITHSPTIFSEGGSDVVITLSCRGYIDWLNNYIYTNDAPTSTTVEDKIIDVLDADPNNIISTDQTAIEVNGVLVSAFEDQNRTASTIINEAVAMGDIYGNRWLFGIYEDRKPVYKAIPDTLEYYTYISSESQRVTNLGNGTIASYAIRPGKFTMIKDVVMGKLTIYTQLRVDERVMFIEQVEYEAPSKVDLRGSKVSTYAQLLARIGL